MLNDLWTGEKFTRGQAWADLLLITNFKDGFIRVNGSKVIIKRGQCGWSEAKLSERWGWSRTKIRSFISELIEADQIKQEKDRRKSVITICNYSIYQDEDELKRHQKDIRKTSERP
jgi:hypothetical protein